MTTIQQKGRIENAAKRRRNATGRIIDARGKNEGITMIAEKVTRSERNITADGGLHLMIPIRLIHPRPLVLLGETTTRAIILVRGIHRGEVEMGMIKDSMIDTAMTIVFTTKKLAQRVMIAGLIEEKMLD